MTVDEESLDGQSVAIGCGVGILPVALAAAVLFMLWALMQ